MEWCSWLSSTGLAPALAYEYGLLFSRNELEPGDAAHFDHDLLKSMGIAVAKHRLEILKLAKKHQQQQGKNGGGDDDASSAATRLARRAGRCLARCARRLAGGGAGSGRRRGASSVTVVPRICSSGDDAVRVGAVQRRGAATATATATASASKKMMLMITDGGGFDRTRGGRGARLSASSQKASLMFHDCYHDDDDDGGSDGDDEERCSEDGAAEGEIKWDSMFQDLKPT